MLYIIAILAAVFAMPAKADEQTQQVGNVSGHTMSLYRLAGITFFLDGSTGTIVATGTSDAVVGSGSMINGYSSINFAVLGAMG